MKKKKRIPPLNLKRKHRVMIRFDNGEIEKFKSGVKRSGLSQTEYGRRKILDVPIADVTGESER